jgi:eRF1 domain 1
VIFTGRRGQSWCNPVRPTGSSSSFSLSRAESRPRVARTTRRVVTESSTGSTESHRVRLNLTVCVEKVVFSASAAPTTGTPTTSEMSGGAAALHISGPVTSENVHVKLGAYHTLDLEAGRDFTVIKGPGGWDSVGLDRVRESTEATRGAEVGAVVCGEGTFVSKSHECYASRTDKERRKELQMCASLRSIRRLSGRE